MSQSNFDHRVNRTLEPAEIIRLCLVQLAWYPVVIAYPIDLGTIRERISNGYYRRSNALKWDVKKMEENAKNFNEKGSQIIEQVKIVTKVLLKYIE